LRFSNYCRNDANKETRSLCKHSVRVVEARTKRRGGNRRKYVPRKRSWKRRQVGRMKKL
jgi:hypothetical protein